MTNDEILKRKEAIYKVIRDANDELENLRTICEHEAVEKVNYSYRVGNIGVALICKYCGEFIRYI